MNPIIKGKIPFIDEFSSVEEAFNFMAKKLNSSFFDDGSSANNTVRYEAEGALFTVSITTPPSPSIVVVGSTTLVHNLGYIPRAVLYAGGFYNSGGTVAYFMGFDWSGATSTQVTISGVTQNPGDTVTFKVFLLK